MKLLNFNGHLFFGNVYKCPRTNSINFDCIADIHLFQRVGKMSVKRGQLILRKFGFKLIKHTVTVLVIPWHLATLTLQ